MRLRAGCRALIGRERGIALNQLHAIDRHAQLFGDQLHLRREEALAELALAGVRGDAAVGGDRDPRVELLGVDAAVDALRRTLRLREPSDRRHAGDAEGDDQRAGRFRKSRRENRRGQRVRARPESTVGVIMRLLARCAYRLMA